MALDPIDEVLVDYIPVDKGNFRVAHKKLTLYMANVAELQSTDTGGRWLIDIGGNRFQYDPTDTTSIDNGTTVIIDLSGVRRYKLQPSHPDATTSVSGFMSAADKLKLNGVLVSTKAFSGSDDAVFTAAADAARNEGHYTVWVHDKGSTWNLNTSIAGDITWIAERYGTKLKLNTSIGGAAAFWNCSTRGRFLEGFEFDLANATNNDTNAGYGLVLNAQDSYVKNCLIYSGTPTGPWADLATEEAALLSAAILVDVRAGAINAVVDGVAARNGGTCIRTTTAARGFIVKNCRVKDYFEKGIRLLTSAAALTAEADPVLARENSWVYDSNLVGAPLASAYAGKQPFSVNVLGIVDRTPRGLRVTNNKFDLPIGPHVNGVHNTFTSDALSCHGVDDALIAFNSINGGGELGITCGSYLDDGVAHSGDRIKIIGNDIKGCDLAAISLGIEGQKLAVGNFVTANAMRDCGMNAAAQPGIQPALLWHENQQDLIEFDNSGEFTAVTTAFFRNHRKCVNSRIGRMATKGTTITGLVDFFDECTFAPADAANSFNGAASVPIEIVGQTGLLVDFKRDSYAVVNGGTVALTSGVEELANRSWSSPAGGLMCNGEGVWQQSLANRLRVTSNLSTGESLGVMIEPARSNLVGFSEDLGTANWAETNASMDRTLNSRVAPDGTTTMDKIIGGNSVSAAAVQGVWKQLDAAAQGNTCTFSCVVSADELSYFNISVSGNATTNWFSAAFDLATGVVGTSASNGAGYTFTSSSILDLGNGHFLCTVTGTVAAAASYMYLAPSITASPTRGSFGQPSYNPVTNPGGVHVWGMSCNVGPDRTSYVKTPTTAAVTLAKDNHSATLYGLTVGEFAFDGEFVCPAAFAGRRVIASVSDGTANNRLEVSLPSGANTIEIDMVSGGVAQFDVTGAALTAGKTYRYVVAVSKRRKQVTWRFVDQETLVVTASGSSGLAGALTALTPFTPTRQNFGANYAGNEQINSTIADVNLFSRFVSAAEAVRRCGA